MISRIAAVPAGLATLALLAAWGGRPRDPAVVTIAARDFAYTVPATVPAGLVELRMVNTGREMHHMQLVRLQEGHTAAELVGALQAGPPPAWAEAMGGPNAVAPGDTANSIQELSPGNYAILCFIPSSDKVPHFMKGMHRDLRVVGSSAPRAAEPKADVTMKLVDYGFQLSEPLTAGRRTIRVENVGPQEHEVVLVRYHSGKSFADFHKWEAEGMKGPPPLDLLGGVVGLAPGRYAYFTAEVTPGTYGLICFVPDAKDGKPHLAHGMVQELQVAVK